MQMVYNSDSFVVVQFNTATAETGAVAGATQPPQGTSGFEIVDKQGRADVFLHGAVAERFQQGALALMQQAQGAPDLELLDDYIAGFVTLGRQPLTLH